MRATYSPDDNKLRLYPSARLDAETYAKAKAAGLRWAPKQQLFFAPAWSPAAEDFLLDLCDEVGDEDTSLVERAEERSERFEEYGEKRASEAERAQAAANATSQRFEFGQPILVGHHSEKRARRDKERIESGLRRAVKLWDTSKYWEQRAKGAIRAAKYKERADVRHRRIKKLESERRGMVAKRTRALDLTKLWAKPGLTRDDALRISGGVDYGHGLYSDLCDGKVDVEGARERAKRSHAATCEWAERRIAHLDGRLAYERAMLDDQGGIPAARFDLAVGGQVLGRWGWEIVKRVNRQGDRVLSVSTAGRGVGKLDVEEIKDYRPPAEGDAEKVKKALARGPLVNYPGEGFRHMTSAEWAKVSRWSEFSRATRVAASEKHSAHRLRVAPKEGQPYYDVTGVYVTDQKRVDPPPPAAEKAALPALEAPPPRPERPPVAREPDPAEALRATLKAGVRVVVADQLFPTPPELAARMVSLAEIDGSVARVLEPSAGTGNLVKAVQRAGHDPLAVEVDARLAEALEDVGNEVRCADFLLLEPTPDGIGTFDRVVMNPPFAKGADVAHVLHALKFLRPGGVLVALVANGPRQREVLKPLVEARQGSWEDLPDGSFAEQGTSVRVALLKVRRRRARGAAS